MWQSFAAIGRGTSEIWLPKEKKTSAVKQNYRSGRPNEFSPVTVAVHVTRSVGIGLIHNRSMTLAVNKACRPVDLG